MAEGLTLRLVLQNKKALILRWECVRLEQKCFWCIVMRCRSEEEMRVEKNKWGFQSRASEKEIDWKKEEGRERNREVLNERECVC